MEIRCVPRDSGHRSKYIGCNRRGTAYVYTVWHVQHMLCITFSVCTHTDAFTNYNTT